MIVPTAICVFAALGALAIPFPQLLGNGKNAVELAALDRLALPLMLALVLLKPLVTVACLGTGAPGGLFTPTLATGALLGGSAGISGCRSGLRALPAPSRWSALVPCLLERRRGRSRPWRL